MVTTLVSQVDHNTNFSLCVVQYHDLEILAKKGCLSASLADILLRFLNHVYVRTSVLFVLWGVHVPTVHLLGAKLVQSKFTHH